MQKETDPCISQSIEDILCSRRKSKYHAMLKRKKEIYESIEYGWNATKKEELTK